MVQKHIAELAAIGVKRPTTIPCFYRVAASLLEQGTEIQVPGQDSSGEAEFVLFSSDHGLLVGIGSDHTDRKVESYDVTVSKQMCAKPVGNSLWRFEEVEPHWDELLMLAWRESDGKRVLYQEGPVTRMHSPKDLLQRCFSTAELPRGTAMFCGTQPVIGELAFGDAFELELYDPRLNRSLCHHYAVNPLPVAG